MFDHVCTEVKVSFYYPNEVFLPLFVTQVFFLPLYFSFTLLIRPKNACKGRFFKNFYLHVDEQGKTRS